MNLEQLIAHLFGDYVLQSKWMAHEKVKRSFPALVHVVFYTIPFLFITQSPLALAGIMIPHFFIDRFGLAQYVVKLRDLIGPKSYKGKEVPVWISFWLLVIADNSIHLLTNMLAIKYLDCGC